jgi:hypothetical protein
VSPADNSASGTAGSGPPHCMTGELADLLISRVESWGLDSRLVTYRGDDGDDEGIEEIVVVNPAARERGEVRVGDDGSVTWEYFGSFDEAGLAKILDAVTGALQATGKRLAQDHRS